MRLLSLLVALSILFTACISGDDDSDPSGDDATTPPSATATEVVDAPGSNTAEPEPEATETVEQTPTVESQPSPTTSEEPTADPETTFTSTDGATSLEAEIDQIAEETAQVRGLELQGEINSTIIDREQLRENLLQMIEQDYGQEGADLDRDLLWILRLIPDRGLDYYELQIDLLTEQVAGYYDSETQELFVIGDEPSLSVDQKVTMSHEIVHAIQDQHFGLDRYDEDDTEFDKLTAFQSVYEGDATWAMVQWAVEYLSLEELGEFVAGSAAGADTETFDSAPRYVQDSLLFAYDAGFQFVERLIAAGGVEAVNAALSDPPVSTEQILHPEKFIEEPRDEPLTIDIPDLSSALGDEWEEVYSGTLGEFDLIILLDENGATDPSGAAAGWGGTGFRLYQSGDDLVSVLSTRWDTLEDAAEFENALRESMTTYEEDGMFWFDGERYHAMFTDADRVVLTASTNRDALQSAFDGQQVNSP